MDGNDTMYGGCSQRDFLARVHTILNSTGARVIVGAEYNCFEMGSCGDFPSRHREKILKAFGVRADEIDTWGRSDCGRGTNVQWSNASVGNCSLKYLNSGFFVGLKQDIHWFLSEIIHSYSALLTQPERRKMMRTHTDQLLVGELFRKYEDKIVLDYAGVLVNNLFGVDMEHGDKKLYEYKWRNNAWVNQLLKVDVCFFHANGKVKEKIEIISHQMSLSARFGRRVLAVLLLSAYYWD
jgi:hypothetical protein